MANLNKINLADLKLIPNLLTLSRLILTPIIAYFLWKGDGQGILICAILLTVAGITDFLDGFFARRLNQITPLGKVLDPLVDKIFTIVIIVELILFRDFPFWLALMIIGRDLLIVILGTLLLRGRKVDLQSNITGKYYFGATAILLGCYVINFEFGQLLFTIITLALWALSSFFYGKRFFDIKADHISEGFKDRRSYKLIRIAITLIISVIFLYRFYFDLITNWL